MLEDILYKIGNLKWMMLFHLLATIIVCGYFYLATRKFSWNRKIFIHFAYLYNLSINEVIAVALLLGRFLFVVTSVIFCKDVFVGYYLILVIFALLIGLFAKDYKLLPGGILYFLVLYILMYIQSQLLVFYSTIDKSWVIIFMVISLGIFVVLSTLYISIGVYESITKKRIANV